MFTKKPKPPTLTREESLNAVAVANRAVQTRERDGGAITLVVPFHASPMVEKISRWLGTTSGGERTIELDAVGSFVWRLCDGQTPVREMIQRLAERYKMNRKEAEVALTTFLRTLASKGLVAIAVLRPEGERTDAEEN